MSVIITNGLVMRYQSLILRLNNFAKSVSQIKIRLILKENHLMIEEIKELNIKIDLEFK